MSPVSPMRRAGRLHAPEVEAIAAWPSGMALLRAPSPGVFMPWIANGDIVVPGQPIGELVVLGGTSAVIAPRSVLSGIAVQMASSASHAVGYGERLLGIDPSLTRATSTAAAPETAAATAEGLVFRAPTSGRFYSRSSPDKPPFVAAGSPLSPGTTICLLEVMKTFHRVTYGGAGLPDTARVVRMLVSDGDDVSAGDPLLALE